MANEKKDRFFTTHDRNNLWTLYLLILQDPRNNSPILDLDHEMCMEGAIEAYNAFMEATPLDDIDDSG